MHVSLYPFILLKNKPSSFSPWFMVRFLLPHSRAVLPLCNKLLFFSGYLLLKMFYSCSYLTLGCLFCPLFFTWRIAIYHSTLILLVILETFSVAPQVIVLPCACSHHSTDYAMFYLQVASPAGKLFTCIRVYPVLIQGFAHSRPLVNICYIFKEGWYFHFCVIVPKANGMLFWQKTSPVLILLQRKYILF